MFYLEFRWDCRRGEGLEERISCKQDSIDSLFIFNGIGLCADRTSAIYIFNKGGNGERKSGLSK